MPVSTLQNIGDLENDCELGGPMVVTNQASTTITMLPGPSSHGCKP